MHSFQDTTGRTWELTITLGAAMRIKDRLGIDLLTPEMGDPPLLTVLGNDAMLLGKVIASLMEKQFDKHEIDEADVLDVFVGKVLMDAQAAFWDEYADFFQNWGRTDRATAIRKQAALIAAAVVAAAERIDAIDVEATIHSAISGKSPDPLESTPDP